MTTDLSALLPDDLPPGHLVGLTDDAPLYWLGDEPVDIQLYRRLVADHARTGLWPVIAEGLEYDVRRPWIDPGELTPEPVDAIDVHEPELVLRSLWSEMLGDEEDLEEYGDSLAPFGAVCPGLADAGTPVGSPEELATWLAGDGEPAPASRLLLAKAARSADLPAVVGWNGPLNHSNDVAPLLATVRSWEDRFGVRVVKLGFDTLELSVAAPPTTKEHALHVAAEHWAFCPDNVDQGAGTLAEYAASIRGVNNWSFWWD
ncbi:hypothetical protein BWI15_00590 [Kribbella sp. ALI-6-A]|uniref:DUF4253 domain-containing protein n=1 Tax=Kribbella sp. ALI-6-A TaxID=1933817 RepID=UPI00097BD679|nr:DUF4253 domain-containing protein [Kribbella sp. ALI-6-A]ONI78410.1 hypothetical protein BWI15_00590 [Kribbella sp. ALI-6-A]